MDDPSRRIATLFGAAGYEVDRPHTLPSNREVDVFAAADQALVIECETRLGALDAAQGQVLQAAEEVDAEPVIVIADELLTDDGAGDTLSPARRERIEATVHVLTERELRDRLTADS